MDAGFVSDIKSTCQVMEVMPGTKGDYVRTMTYSRFLGRLSLIWRVFLMFSSILGGIGGI